MTIIPKHITISEVLELIGYTAGDRITIGSSTSPDDYRERVIDVADVQAEIGRLAGRNTWFSLNPPSRPVGSLSRGTSAEFTALNGLYADLDVKPGGCRDYEVAQRIIDDLSEILCTRPVVITSTGHGLQPIWALEDCDDIEVGIPLLRRFGRMVSIVAESRKAKVDSVFDVARMLRCAGTVNVKAEPVTIATAVAGGGAPLTVEQVDDRLLEMGIYQLTDDADTGVESEPVLPSGDWVYAASPCGLAVTLANEWPNDIIDGGRHPVMYSRMHRVNALWRNGCLDEHTHRKLIEVVEQAHTAACARPGDPRPVGRYEFRDGWKKSRERVERKTDQQIQTELVGNGKPHIHLDQMAGQGMGDDFFNLGEDGEPREAPAPWLTVDGAAFILDQPKNVPAIWGTGGDVLWPEGEGLMILGGQGLGKTTLAGQLVRGLLGLDSEVLGYPVNGSGETVLYLAMDRPRQIARSLARQFTEAEREMLKTRLLIRPGPPHADLAKDPHLLAKMVTELGASFVFVDSLKDAAVGLSDDEVGASYNRARQHVLHAGRQICDLHHVVKRGDGSIADAYGSTWLTSGCGSVITLTGDPGDPVVGFRHAKPSVNEVGPYRLAHNPIAGRLSIVAKADLLTLASSSPDGVTKQEAARAMNDTDDPTAGEVLQAARDLNKLVSKNVLMRIDGTKGGRGGGTPTRWYPA